MGVGQRVFLILVVAMLLLIAASFFDPDWGRERYAKHQKTYIQLNNLAQAVQLYHDQYRRYPVFSPEIPGQDYVLRLKYLSPAFLQVMTGHPPAELQMLNPKRLTFFSASDSDLTPDRTRLVDAYGNQDLVIIMDTDGDGVIAPFTVTMASADGRRVTVRQTKPIHANVIAMSPGRGLGDADAVTTWDVR